MQGGALFGFDASFIGMDLFSDVQRSIFLPRSIILDRLKDLETSIKKRVFRVMLKSVRCANLFLICLSMFVVATFSVYL